MSGPEPAAPDRRAVAAPVRRRAEPAADARTAATTAPVGSSASSIGRLGLQARTRVGAVADPAEREADSVADRVMRTPVRTAAGPPGTGPAGLRRSPAPGAVAQPPPTPDVGRDAVRRQPAPATVVEPPAGSPAADVRPEDLRRSPVTGPRPPELRRQPVPITSAPPQESAPDRSDEPQPPSAAGPDGGDVDDAVQTYLDRAETTGVPLPPAARGFFETTFGRDLGHVRVHDDPGADTAARSIGALAFTRGPHIHFASGQYDPVSEPGRRLLAHEITHVVQQDARVRRRPVGDTAMRQPSTKPPPPTSPVYTDKDGNVFDAKNRTLDIPVFGVPAAKEPLLKKDLPLTVRPKSTRTNTRSEYETLWRDAASKKIVPKVRARVAQLGKEAEAGGTDLAGSAPPSPTVYYLEYGTAGNWNFVGTPEEIAAGLWRPVWDKDGDFGLFQIDHKVDWMVGGENKIDNLRLLDAKANMSLGGLVGTRLSKLMDRIYLEALPNIAPPRPRRETFDEKFVVRVLGLTVSGDKPAGEPGRIWELSDTAYPNLDSDDLVGHLKPLPAKRRKELLGEADRVVVFSSAFGGSVHDVPLVDGKADLGKGKRWRRESVFEVTAVELTDPAPNSSSGVVVGKLVVHPFRGNKYVSTKEVDLKIISMAAVKHGGYVSTSDARDQIRLAATKWSPIEVDTLDFDVATGFLGRARLLSDLPLLRSADIGLVLDERGIGLNAILPGSALSFPGPFHVTGGMLELYGSLDEVSARGDVFFEIERLARGRIGAVAGTRTGFELDGEIDFDTDLFTRARVTARYHDGKWGVSGELGIGPKKVPGIRTATVRVGVDDDTVEAEGEFESSITGLDRGTLRFRYDPAAGMLVEGDLTLSKLPGISGGRIAATVAQRADGQGWSLAGLVTAQPSLPGVSGQVTGTYTDGAFLVDADLAYRRGMLDGRVHLGLTNQAVGPDGRPAGPATDRLLTYGGGLVTLRLAPWLAASAGLELKPNGEMVVTGRIAVPQAVDLFGARRFDRNVFSIGLDVPIIGVAVAGQRIGIFATVRGGLDASAGIGPGQLRGLALEVTYNPDRESDTRVVGTGQFVVPADAGLRLFVRGGVGAGIPVVSATAGLEVSGGLGLAGAAQAGVEVLWTPASGLVLDARGEIYVEPRFRFAVDAFVDVTADLWVTTVDIYSKRWSLAAVEFGSGMRFGLLFPLHYEEGKPFTLDPAAVEFVHPPIEAGQVLRGLVGQIIG